MKVRPWNVTNVIRLRIRNAKGIQPIWKSLRNIASQKMNLSFVEKSFRKLRISMMVLCPYLIMGWGGVGSIHSGFEWQN